MEIKKLTIKEFLLKYLEKDFCIESFYIYAEELGYMIIDYITLQNNGIFFYFNEGEEHICIDTEDKDFYIYKII